MTHIAMYVPEERCIQFQFDLWDLDTGEAMPLQMSLDSIKSESLIAWSVRDVDNNRVAFDGSRTYALTLRPDGCEVCAAFPLELKSCSFATYLLREVGCCC